MLYKEANQPETVYVGTILAEERTSTSMGEEVGPSQEVATLAARDLAKLKVALEAEEAKVFSTLQQATSPYGLRLITDIKVVDWGDFQQQMIDGWNQAQQIIKDVALDKAVTIDSVVEA